uniref:MAB_1171c family putative transporter n=1 Tax=Amycolatopsis sp. CA-151526 TaxID=3239921 RepID=UPI003F497C9C
MAALLFYLVTVVAVAAAIVRARRVRTSPNRAAAAAYVLLLAALAIVFAVMATPSQAWVNRFVPDLFKLVGNTGTLVAAFAATMLVAFTARPHAHPGRLIGRRAAVLAAAVAVLIVTFCLPHPVTLTGSFDAYLAIDPTLVVYTITYSAYLVVCGTDFTVNVWRFSAHPEGLLRVGLRILAVGGIAGIAYAVAKIAIVVQHVLTHSRTGAGDAGGVCHAAFSSPACAVAVGAPALAATLLLIGVLFTAGAARAEHRRRLLRYRRTLRRLEPLHRALRAALPEIGRGADVLPHAQDVPLALAQRVVEIRDGLLLLSPYRRPDVAEAALARTRETGLSGPEQAAVVEAAQLAAALTDHAAGRPPDTPASHAPTAGSLTSANAAEDGDFDTELSWLDRVAHAYATSPIVAAQRTGGTTIA